MQSELREESGPRDRKRQLHRAGPVSPGSRRLPPQAGPAVLGHHPGTTGGLVWLLPYPVQPSGLTVASGSGSPAERAVLALGEKTTPGSSSLRLPYRVAGRRGKGGLPTPRKQFLSENKSGPSAPLPPAGPGLRAVGTGWGCRGLSKAAVHAQHPAQLVTQHLLEARWQGQALQSVP